MKASDAGCLALWYNVTAPLGKEEVTAPIILISANPTGRRHHTSRLSPKTYYPSQHPPYGTRPTSAIDTSSLPDLPHPSTTTTIRLPVYLSSPTSHNNNTPPPPSPSPALHPIQLRLSILPTGCATESVCDPGIRSRQVAADGGRRRDCTGWRVRLLGSGSRPIQFHAYLNDVGYEYIVYVATRSRYISR
jgi:hypothetical protein